MTASRSSTRARPVRPPLLTLPPRVQFLTPRPPSPAPSSPTGTGKSILLKQMIKSLRQKWPVRDYPGAVAVTASTGIAGYNIGGHTLHSFGASCEPPPSSLPLCPGHRACSSSCSPWRCSSPGGSSSPLATARTSTPTDPPPPFSSFLRSRHRPRRQGRRRARKGGRKEPRQGEKLARGKGPHH